MLQVKDLVKRYNTKGETVTALGGVSVNFPERGMVFLLGRSGSGKSTLLNVAGGLDAPDEGEVIVKGKSSKDFSKSDFDSYRNTYVGFIFQEYNILEELTVAENVALAIELQGQPRDRERVDRILEEVDLKGLGDRRPNTLSGGQKQRVAIARALVKEPEIIMADEPTGALDSTTGTQVFETLKKLSAEKLVVVVSHDREFAERYADRIIELKDGLIVSDVERGGEAVERANLAEVDGKKLTVACGAALSDEEVDRIVAFLKRNKGSVVISAEKEQSEREREGETFRPTVQREPVPEEETGKFIRSRFPMRYAFKMGLSSLKIKPVRLVFTTLLATVAFIIFGIFSTLVTFNEGRVAARALDDSFYQTVALVKQVPAGGNTTANVRYVTEDVERLQSEHEDLNLIPVYNFDRTMFSISACTDRTHAKQDVYHNTFTTSGFTGFADASYLRGNPDLPLVAGRLPETTSEGVISVAMWELFHSYKYVKYVDPQNVDPEDEEQKPVAINSYADLIGKEIAIRLDYQILFHITVVGIVDPYDDFTRYTNRVATGEAITASMQEELIEHYENSLSAVCFVHPDFYDLNLSLDESEDNLARDKKIYYGAMDDYTEDSEYPYRYQYLFTSLHSERSDRSTELMTQLHKVYDEERDIRYYVPYSFTSDVARARSTVDDLFTLLGTAAILLAIFAALLLFNFISASISHKKRDIGILRAVGARGIDVFKIFLVEASAITLFCFLLACLGAFGACFVINDYVMVVGVMRISVFLFGWENCLFVLGIALLTALFATLIPVKLTVRKKPVEAIRAL